MRKFFYPRLAVSNLVKNKTIYLPYLLAGSLMVMLYYTLCAVGDIAAATDSQGAQVSSEFVKMCASVCQYMIAVVMFYINSFVMKRRKREFGLFSILGMEKRHIGLLIGWEVVLCAAFTLLAGVAVGILCGQLGFLILMKLLGEGVALEFTVGLGPILQTLRLFAVVWGLVLLYDLVGIWKLSPIQLLHSASQGEKEPRARWMVTLLGLVTLIGGYAIALRVKDTAMAMLLFFPAVLLVMIGTYCLFMSGSIALLKFLKKRRRFYYRPENFIAVSGMIYRMKQNAAGLASICILSTMVVVTLSGTLSLYLGGQEFINATAPRAMNVSAYFTANIDRNTALLRDWVKDKAGEYNAQPTNEYWLYEGDIELIRQGDSLSTAGEATGWNTLLCMVTTLDGFNAATGSERELQPGRALIWRRDGQTITSLDLGGRAYETEMLPSTYGMLPEGGSYPVLIVLPSYEDLMQMQSLPTTDGEPRVTTYLYGCDFSGGEASLQALDEDLNDAWNYNEFLNMSEQQVENGIRRAGYDTRTSVTLNFNIMFGSVLFIAIFFVGLFLLTTVLIIYYKQVSEGYDDRDRFVILQKVGMSQKEVRRTIQKQVLMVFFLPLGMAALHMAFAFPALCRILRGFMMTNIGLFALCTVGTLAAFAALYGLVYHLTARTYFKLVRA